MIRLAVSVEGQAEEAFIKSVLAKHLQQSCGFSLVQPILLGRARGHNAGGGNVTVERLVSEMAYLLRSFNAVTSLVDFYGFKGKKDCKADDLVNMVQKGVEKKVGGQGDRIIPYVQMHEFEGLLFSDVDAFSSFDEAAPSVVQALREIRNSFESPEDINDDENTAPSRRILKAMPRYSKKLHGPLIAETIGLERIRKECPRFKKWINCLESLQDRISTSSSAPGSS